jgi:hypothetical protein
MAELSYFVYQGAKSKLQAYGLTSAEAEALLARPEIQQVITDYRAGKPIPPSITALSAPGTLDRFRSLSKSTGMSFSDVAIGSAFPPSMPTRKPASSFQPFAQGGALWQNPNAPGVDRGRARMAAQSSPTLAMGHENAAFNPPAGGAEHPFFSAIRTAEGVSDAKAIAAGFASGYDVPLGYGKYGMPSKPITQMTLKEAYDYGREILNHPDNNLNSSAIGGFQIVGKTLKDFMGPAGLTWDDTFSVENQQKLAIEIAKVQGVDSGTWQSFGLAKNKNLLATARATFPSAAASIGRGAALDWSNIGGAADLPAGAPGINSILSQQELLSLALNPTGASAPSVGAPETARVSPIGGVTPSSIGGTRATPSSFAPLSATSLGGVGASPSSFAPTSTISLPANVATKALGPNVATQALGPNATARPLPIGTARQGVAPVATAPAPVRMPTVSMPAQPMRPASPGETYGALPPSTTQNALPPSQTLTALSPGATLQALPPNLTAKPVAPTTLAATPPTMLAASNPFSKPLAASGATTPLAASNPFSTLGATAASLSPAVQPRSVPTTSMPAPQLAPPPIRPIVSAYSNQNPTGRAAAGFSGPYTGALASREFMFPGQTGWTSAGVPTSHGRAMNVGQPSFDKQAIAQGLSNAANILTAHLSLSLATATYGGFNTNHRYAFRDRAHELSPPWSGYGGGGGSAGGGGGGGSITGNVGTNAKNLSAITAGNLAAQRRALVYGR